MRLFKHIKGLLTNQPSHETLEANLEAARKQQATAEAKLKSLKGTLKGSNQSTAVMVLTYHRQYLTQQIASAKKKIQNIEKKLATPDDKLKEAETKLSKIQTQHDEHMQTVKKCHSNAAAVMGLAYRSQDLTQQLASAKKEVDSLRSAVETKVNPEL